MVRDFDAFSRPSLQTSCTVDSDVRKEAAMIATCCLADACVSLKNWFTTSAKQLVQPLMNHGFWINISCGADLSIHELVEVF